MTREETIGEGESSTVTREQAWELFKGGMQKKSIAATLGVCAKTVTRWSQADNWGERLEAIKDQAVEIRDQEAIGETVELLRKVDDRLGYVLDRIPESKTDDLANTARAADHLSKTRERLQGKPADGGKRPDYVPLTLQNLVLLATGGPGAPELDPTAIRGVLGEGEVIAAEFRMVGSEEENVCPPNVS